ncbi:transcriptional regulator, sigma54-dependent [Desulfosarcina variabilis str. Montpellier]|uniref:sigma-54 interaction domain-containing protein n=1 Tax=Desulfosarcina variabilis TaxID=2300 RepID=UPI003AFA1617
MASKIVKRHQDTILNSINEGVFTVDLNWRITSFNRAAEKITRVRSMDAIGRPCGEVFRTSICETACPMKQTLATGKPMVNVMTRIVTQSGNQIPIRLSTAPLKEKDGTVVGGVETFQDLTQVEQLRKALEANYTFEDIIGRTPVMRDLFQMMPQIAESDSTVLISGASGTGKELFARAIHNLSDRKKKPFIAVNCGALPDTLLESELFGYRAGAFTGARKNKPGRFALAQGGSILLDEIGDISPAMQVRLLRVLQEKRIEPLGAVHPVAVDVRVVAAANQDLETLVREKKFRKDLFYRIRVVELKLPDLQQRRMDIPLLVDHMVGKFNRLKNKDIAGVSQAVMLRLMAHHYPGNVRELENIIEHGFALCHSGLIEIHHLPPEFCMESDRKRADFTETRTLKAMERLMIEEALARHSGNRRLAAKDLGIDDSTLYRKIRTLKISPPPTDGRSRKK